MNKYAVKYSRAYKTSRKKLNKSDKELLESVVSKLASGKTLEARFKDHALSGDYEGFRDCHVRPDLVLIYRINGEILELYLALVGSHAEIFG